MGLATGKAAVGNHGSDTMQRLATIGYVFTEAMRLQETMGRRVLQGRKAAPFSADLLGGRCLVIGRTMQDVEATLCYQVIGAVSAGELMPACDRNDVAKTVAYARAKNNAAVVVGNSTRHRQKNKAQADPRKATPSNSPPAAPLDVLASSGALGSPAHEPLCPFPTVATHTNTTRNCILLTVLVPPTRDGGTCNYAAQMGEEWLYEMQHATQMNPYESTNHAILRLWTAGSNQQMRNTSLTLDVAESNVAILPDDSPGTTNLAVPALSSNAFNVNRIAISGLSALPQWSSYVSTLLSLDQPRAVAAFVYE